jgi:UDP-glucuronate decarboxylase
MSKSILVTGGAGFLGSHLCKKLLKEGNKVFCLDNLQTGSIKNIEDISDNNFKYLNHDIQQKLCIDHDIHEIYNLACPASPIKYQADSIDTIKTNFLGALNVLELGLKKNAVVFQASTSEVYGDPYINPQHESYWGNVNPVGIRSCYDEGKRIAETLFMDFARKYDLRVKIVRIFNTFGPSMSIDDGRVVSNFIVQALQGNEITIYGNGSQTRSFCYVDDLIEGFLKMMGSPSNITGPINLGNPSEFTVLELAHKIIALTDSTSKIIFKELPLDDPKQRKPDIDKAMKLISWSPQVNLEDGLKETIKYFSRILKLNR